MRARSSAEFRVRYGPWAIVGGASEGLGRAFATELARRAVHVVLVARRPGPLEALAADITAIGTVKARTVAADLATSAGHDAVAEAVADLDVGLVVANAAFSPIGSFVDTPLDDLLRALDVNCRSAVRLARSHLPLMQARGSGGLVLMSSLAGLQGSPGLSTYAATKAFLTTLAEGLWFELRPLGVDVVGCCAGAVATPGLAAASTRRAPGTLPPEVVARATLDALGSRCRLVPGSVNRVAAFAMVGVLPRRAAVAIMAKASSGLARAGWA